MLADQRLSLATDLLLPFSHWVAPRNVAARYECRFFLAVAPEGQRPLADHSEVADLMWIDPLDALQSHRCGRLPLIAPTVANLRMLADYPDRESLLREYRTRVHFSS